MRIYGIDLSKDKFDVSYVLAGEEKKRFVRNDFKGICNFLKQVEDSCILVAEHTGSYGDLLVHLCYQFQIKIALVPGYNIKHSLGLQRGKSDSKDAYRIRKYGERFVEELRFMEPRSESVKELKELYSLREQLSKSRTSLLLGQKTRKLSPSQSIVAHRGYQRAIANLENEIDAIEKEIEKIVQNDSDLNDNYKLITSIKGIGPVIANNLIIKTENFKRINTAKKAAAFAGVCPYPNSSGKMSMKSKTSHMADKKLKSLLFLAAKTAVTHNKEYSLYAERKKLEGKPYFLIMNNVSNKMLRTVYGVIQSRKPYDMNHICNDPRQLN
ncbi:IS110 family transposase [Flagellimonas taeanensis]|uniref:transposase n=1 Tax=Flagellimonas taeanensis TaxID=1005926 RepID=UPI000E69CC83|nr:transposase [Allomuricauda taeanensis]RIV51577.1 IS110 family transposase [Allomuricauda taeanensis]RIV51726.1 IS110 family transposase [Allomuricauda taeanensis]RIV51738.1 IS110 family transposase [Allomuricauda taeanensis]RIV52282.1 IS110 family transposase [Allomuricauda taeanensis]